MGGDLFVMREQVQYNAEFATDTDGLRAQLYRDRKHLTHLPTIPVKLEGEARVGDVLRAELCWEVQEGEIIDGMRVWGSILGREVDWYAPFWQGRVIVDEDNSVLSISYKVDLC